MFINKEYIYDALEQGKKTNKEDISKILNKARNRELLSHIEIASILYTDDSELLKEIYSIADEIKKDIYGNRIVLFAPLYISDYCVNNCRYCGYKKENNFKRRKLTLNEIEKEVKLLNKLGHKRLALEVGEDPVNCDIDYVISAIKKIYETSEDIGNIRRINVNIAATTVDNYKKLKKADIGTYILFQETYDKEMYEKMHPNCLKGDYEYHLTAFDRAMEAGIDDVGGGVLFGLADPYFEFMSLLVHNGYLEEKYGVGFHTISVPRLRKAEGVDLDSFPYIVDDEMFKKLVAIIRIAVPYIGIILSTRETASMRKELIKYGVSQISAGSCTGVGGYSKKEEGETITQFKLEDERSPLEILKELINDNHIPSYCTACYRSGRTGERFMNLAKHGDMQNICTANALITCTEFIEDYGDEKIKEIGQKLINNNIDKIEDEKTKQIVVDNIKRIKNGERDLYI